MDLCLNTELVLYDATDLCKRLVFVLIIFQSIDTTVAKTLVVHLAYPLALSWFLLAHRLGLVRKMLRLAGVTDLAEDLATNLGALLLRVSDLLVNAFSFHQLS